MRFRRLSLSAQIVMAIVLGVAAGWLLRDPERAGLLDLLSWPPTLVLKALKAIATPLVLLAVLNAFLGSDIPAKTASRLALLLLSNTLAAILIGLLVANLIQPGRGAVLAAPVADARPTDRTFDPLELVSGAIPATIVEPLADNNVVQVVVLALALGTALRLVKSRQERAGREDFRPLERTIATLFETVVEVLSWVVALVPLAVLGVIARVVAKQGFAPFRSLAWFIVAVLVALLLQACFYLLRVRLQSWVRPVDFIRGGRDAFWTAFSTASSTITMPVTYRALTERIGLRQSSASLGALVGSSFNNDGTALYEAMAALFIAQFLGMQLSLQQQAVVVATSVIASVGAAGIPEAGLVTMTLVFTAVGLPVQYIVLLITVDWFLDRCRTAINVMGDMTVAAVLDGRTRSLTKG
ncbi:MAG: dicarboxylate/amino acid:cation symporter [Planctomycetia bacterium]|nr:dicarboxylate/amino acid:cation symporter [Planctomycetia bacterium]